MYRLNDDIRIAYTDRGHVYLALLDDAFGINYVMRMHQVPSLAQYSFEH